MYEDEICDARFKPGDRVRVTEASVMPRNFNVVGAIGTVVDTSFCPTVDFDNPQYGNRFIAQDRLALITDEPVEGPKVYERSAVTSMTLDPDVILDLVGDYLNAIYGITEKPVSVVATNTASQSSCSVRFDN